MDLGDHLLELAKKVAKRVIVKRPRHAIFLANQEPAHQWQGMLVVLMLTFSKLM